MTASHTTAPPGAPHSAPGGLPKVQTYDYALFGPVEPRRLGGIRRLIGQRLGAAWVNVPQVTLFDEADITELDALIQRLKPAAAGQGIKLTPLALIIKACVHALQAVPEVNASLSDAGDAVILKKYYHIGFAVAAPAGLLTPVVKDADRKDLLTLARAVADLAAKARAGKLAFTDAEGGCFSVSNLGTLGGNGFTPLVNAPEAAILGVGRASQKPVLQDGGFVPRLMLPLSLSFDHRVIDGVTAGNGLKAIREALQQPETLAG